MLKFLATYYTSITKSHNFFCIIIIIIIIIWLKERLQDPLRFIFWCCCCCCILFLKNFIMAVINFCLFLKCSFLILKFSHFLHIHNKVKKSLNLKFSNYLFFCFIIIIIIIRLQDPRFLFLLLLLLLLFYFIYYYLRAFPVWIPHFIVLKYPYTLYLQVFN